MEWNQNRPTTKQKKNTILVDQVVNGVDNVRCKIEFFGRFLQQISIA